MECGLQTINIGVKSQLFLPKKKCHLRRPKSTSNHFGHGLFIRHKLLPIIRWISPGPQSVETERPTLNPRRRFGLAVVLPGGTVAGDIERIRRQPWRGCWQSHWLCRGLLLPCASLFSCFQNIQCLELRIDIKGRTLLFCNPLYQWRCWANAIGNIFGAILSWFNYEYDLCVWWGDGEMIDCATSWFNWYTLCWLISESIELQIMHAPGSSFVSIMIKKKCTTFYFLK